MAVAVTVAQRVREIGIRTALGADRRRIVRLFVGRGLRLSLAGLTIGLALSVVAARAIAAAEGDTPPSGLLPLSIGAAVFVMAVALGASWIPARRAPGADPLIALRADEDSTRFADFRPDSLPAPRVEIVSTAELATGRV